MSIPRPSKVDRFRLLRRLGSGGMGVVYQAEDLERQTIVALKTLPRLEPDAIYQFKREFRLLAGIAHPNLVTLYELFAEGDDWFISMEYVDGLDFLSAVRPEGVTIQVGEPTVTAPIELIPPPQPSQIRRPPGDPEKVRAFGAQIVEGLEAIHAAGKLHCDVKPANVLITRENRAILLDFGLVADLHTAIGQHDPQRLRGTLAYMSPEQSEMDVLGAATDWYALGVMMFQALTGQTPFPGTPAEILEAKRARSAPGARSVIRSIPEDLDELCSKLLERDPARRPQAAEILRVLSRSEHVRMAVSEPRVDDFVGRADELAQLHAALDSTAVGAALALVDGASGVGKSALVNRFLKDAESTGALVFAGRCYEHEAVPFRAVDSVIDSLGNFLSRFGRDALQSLRPADAGTLARAFPVLGRLHGFEPEPGDAFDTRRRAFGAFRDLVSRLASGRRVVFAIDDLQWGDADSASLLCEAFRDPAPPILLIASFRPGADRTGEFLPPLLEFCAAQGIQPARVPLDPLPPEDAQLLAEKLIGETGEPAHRSAEAVARESSGNPFFIQELARHATAGVAIDEAPTLDALLRKRVQELPAQARHVLEIVAIAGRRIAQADAFHAAGLKGVEPRIAVLLRGSNLVKGGGAGPADPIEPYHDRIRESVVAFLEPDTARSHHLELASTLVDSGRADDEWLAFHFEHGGEKIRAGRLYAAAGARARDVTAFDRSAAHYGRSVELLGGEPDIHALRVTYAEALVLAGRAYEAAGVFLEAARETTGSEASTLSRQAGYHLLVSGHIDEGRAVFRGVLADTRESLPKTELGAVLHYFWYRTRIQMRGLNFKRRGAQPDAGELVERADATYAVGTGLGMADLARAWAPIARSLLLSLEAGDTARVQRAAAMHAINASVLDQPFGKYTLALVSAAQRLAAELDTPLARAHAAMAGAGPYYTWCRWPQMLPLANEAERILAADCHGVDWELDTIRTLLLFALCHLGHYSELWSRASRLLGDAEQRGNVYMAVNLGVFMLPYAMIVLQGTAAARKINAQYSNRWTRQGYHLQHLMSDNITIFSHLADGAHAAAWESINRMWPHFERAQMPRVPNLRIYNRDLRDRAALGVALTAADPRPYLKIAEQDARLQVKERYPHGPAFGNMALGAIHYQRGRIEDAIRLVREGIRHFEQAGMVSNLASARLTLASLVGGDEAATLRAQASAWAASEGITDLDTLRRLHTSGFRDQP